MSDSRGGGGDTVKGRSARNRLGICYIVYGVSERGISILWSIVRVNYARGGVIGNGKLTLTD